MTPPRLLTACGALPPEWTAAPVAWQSQSRGPRLSLARVQHAAVL